MNVAFKRPFLCLQVCRSFSLEFRLFSFLIHYTARNVFLLVQNTCHPNPCKNSGACSESEQGFVCTCVTPYMGPTCEGMFILIFYFLIDVALVPKSNYRIGQ